MLNKLSIFMPHIIRLIYKKIKTSYLQKKWSHNSDRRVIDWNWEKTNFNRIAAVSLLTNKFKNPSYLEIGCDTNFLFNSIASSKKIGVDPCSGGNVKMTSDEFFKSNKTKFDVVFIDGLHTYEQVRRDVINAIRFLNPGGWIGLHDMLPSDWIEQHVPNISMGPWTADGWKVAFELKETEGIEFKILKIDKGVGIIKLNEDNVNLKDFRDQLIQKKYSYYYDNLKNLPIYDWEDAQEWLRS